MNENESASIAPIETYERELARKYGLRELSWPDPEDARTLALYLAEAVTAKRSGPIPKTSVAAMLEFLQGVLTRQYLTKSPSMAFDEYEALQLPYNLASQIVTQILYERRELAASRGSLYQTTQLRLTHFIAMLRSILDPGCGWIVRGSIPDEIAGQLAALREFVERYPGALRRGRDERAPHGGRVAS